MQHAFSDYVLDGDARELRHAGRRVPLSPKAFSLLQALLDASPRALSKKELHALLWPDAVVVEANLSNLVGEVRGALGEDARRPRFIRTLHRFGYAFQAEPPAARSVTVRLRVNWPGGSALLADGEHVMGRDAELAICLASASVSRRHATIRLAEGQARIEDLGSKNGTFVNGRRLAGPATLGDGDEVRAGSVRMTVRLVPPLDSTRTEVSRTEGD
jgi:DNA-binding winged helix-turn-helix (wHTH) protein